MIGLSEIYPEVRADRALEFEDNTADPNRLQRFVPCPPLLWQIRKQSRDIRRRDRRNYVVRREKGSLRLNSDNTVVRYRDLLRRGAKMNAATFRFDCGSQHVDQCLGPASQIAEFLLHDALPRRSNALNSRPYPSRKPHRTSTDRDNFCQRHLLGLSNVTTTGVRPKLHYSTRVCLRS